MGITEIRGISVSVEADKEGVTAHFYDPKRKVEFQLRMEGLSAMEQGNAINQHVDKVLQERTAT